MSAITAWIRALAGAAVFCAIALALCPEGRPKRVLRAACGVVMAAALLSPALGRPLGSETGKGAVQMEVRPVDDGEQDLVPSFPNAEAKRSFARKLFCLLFSRKK